MTKQPPRLAAWLLHRFGPREEFLAGDLAERFQQTQSSSWYWRQAVLGIAHYWKNELRTGGKELLRGWAAWFVLMVGFNAFNLAMVSDRSSLLWFAMVLAMRQAGKRVPRHLGVFLVAKTLYMVTALRTLDFYYPTRIDLGVDMLVLSVVPILQFFWDRVRLRPSV